VHLNLIAALVDNRRTFSPFGVVPNQPHQLCRSCLVRISGPSRSLDRHQVNSRARGWAWTLAVSAPTLRVVGKGSRS
jgi:hypothetical protein